MTKMTITETRPVKQDEIFELWRSLAQELKAHIGLFVIKEKNILDKKQQLLDLIKDGPILSLPLLLS